MAQPANFDFANLLGDAFRRTITLADEDNAPIILTGCSIAMIIRASRNTNAAIFGTLQTSDSSILITDESAGEFDLVWTTLLQADLDFRSAVYDLVVTFPNGDDETYLAGEYNAFEGAVETSSAGNITVAGSNIRVVTIGTQGPPGVGQGASGGTAIAGEVISADKVVILSGGKLYHADPTNIAHAGKVVGIASQSGAMGAPIMYQQAGEVPGGSYTQDSFYFLGLNGALSTTQNASGAVFSQLIGYAKTTSVFVVQMGQPVGL